MGDLTLTNLASDIYVAADTVGREAVGFIPAVTMNAESTRASTGDTIKAAVTPVSSAAQSIGDGAMTIPDGEDQTIGNSVFQINKSKAVQIPLSGEQELQLRNGGNYETVYGDLIAQAMRTLSNEIESDLAVAAQGNFSRWAGTVGTTPFGFSASASGLEDLATVRQQLVDNGAANSDLQGVFNTVAGAKFRASNNIVNVNTSGSSSLRDQGILLPMYGIDIRESSQIASYDSVGTDAAMAINAGNLAAGSTTITVDANTGDATGSIDSGDLFKLAGQDTGYVASGTGTANEAAGGTIVLRGDKGLRNATLNDAAVAVERAAYNPNFVFARSALELAVRAPAVPAMGDAADDAVLVQDPHSGLVFEIRIYKGYHKSMIEVACAWGTKAWKPDFIGALVG
tara:strand:- start:644 stop:1840 length:1197 start_codon:yes stop_codon:yes gene_type:complete